MKYLFSGTMKQDEFDQLFSMSGLGSESVKIALSNSLVKGYDDSTAMLHLTSQSNFSRDLNKLESLYIKIHKYNEVIGVRRVT